MAKLIQLSMVCLTTVLGCGASKGALSDPPSPSEAPPPAPTASVVKAAGPCTAVRPRAVSGTTGLGSSVAFGVVGDVKLLLVADEDHRAIHTIDLGTFTETAVTPLDGAPVNLVLLEDGRVATTLRDRHRVEVLELGTDPRGPLERRCGTSTPAEPWGLAVSTDKKELLVTSAWDPMLTFLSIESLQARRSVPLASEPRGLLPSRDGESVYVTHMRGGIVSRVPMQGDTVERIALLPRGATLPSSADKSQPTGKTSPAEKSSPVIGPPSAGQGFAIVGLGDGAQFRVFAPVASSDTGRFELIRFPNSYGGGGSPAVHEPFVAVIDHATGKPFNVDSFGGVTRPSQCLLPRAVVAFGEQLLVACQGRDTMEVLDGRVADPSMVVNDVVDVPSGPTGIAVDSASRAAYVFSQFAGEVTKIDLALRATPPSRVKLAAGEKPPPAPVSTFRLVLSHPETPALNPEAAAGRALFYKIGDGRLAGGLRACASCHPDGRSDGLVWTTPDGPRQTIFLAGRMKASEPYGWFGDHPTLENHVRFTMKRLGGLGLEEARDKKDLGALLAYAAAIAPPTVSGAVVSEATMKDRVRGREIFFGKARCASCHLGGGGTDAKTHDVGTGDPREKRVVFDTPSLSFIAGSAPYMHDGRYATLMDLIRDPKLKMGETGALDESERAALVAYMESL